MQDPREIEASYQTPDPWGYKTNPDDAMRKQRILDIIASVPKFGNHFERALDIGAGEGWITESLPADAIFGFEISDTAASRFSKIVQRTTEPSGKYDLIIATGVMYGHYDFERFIRMIKDHASGLVVLVNIKAWEVPMLKELGEMIYEEEFPYRDFIEHVRVYDFAA